MPRMVGRVLAAAMAAACLHAGATTWAEPEAVPDPFVHGAECSVSSPMSYGGYIYQWPSKYDQVFWPMTEWIWIARCPASGYVAYTNDFELSGDEKARLKPYLDAQPKLDVAGSDAAVLVRLDDVYRERGASRERRNEVMRAIAYLLEENGDAVGAKIYRERALADIRDALEGELEPERRVEYLFVAATYERELGRPDASDAALAALDQALAQMPREADLESLVAKDSDGDGVADLDTKAVEALENRVGYAEYMRELRGDVARIEPGGKLAPVPLAR